MTPHNLTSEHPEDEDDLLAAEYVLGVLDLPERTAVEARLKADTAFADRVAGWEDRLSDLNGAFAPEPAPDLMPRIEARLFPQAARPANGLRSWWADLRLWSGVAVASVALVAYLALTPPKPELTATLNLDKGALQYAAVITSGRLTITRVAGEVPDAAHSHELWIIAGNDPPVSLGVIPAGGETISLPGAAAGAVLAVTLEPPGGSPTGKPTGPIVAKGALVKA
ncbi:anti-sigma factor [bacterium]|nr:anti-sigma factor [bacterium]